MKQFNDNVKALLPIEDRDLHAYIDGQLSAPQQRRVEAYLKKNPDIAREMADYRHYNDMLKSACNLPDHEDVPRRFQQILNRKPAFSRYGAPALKCGAILGLCGVSAVFGWKLAVENLGSRLVVALHQQEQAKESLVKNNLAASGVETIQPVSETLTAEKLQAMPPIAPETKAMAQPVSPQEAPAKPVIVAPSGPANNEDIKDNPINL